jgi:hypothetical protein
MTEASTSSRLEWAKGGLDTPFYLIQMEARGVETPVLLPGVLIDRGFVLKMRKFNRAAARESPRMLGFVVRSAQRQFQMDKDGKLNLLRFSTVDGQAYEFRRE